MLISTLVDRFKAALSAPSTHSSSEMVEETALLEMEKLSKRYKQYGDLVEKRTVDECISILKKHL